MKKDQIIQFFGFVLLACLLFGAGFYFGYKNYQAKSNSEEPLVVLDNDKQKNSEITQLSEQTINNLPSEQPTQTSNKDIFWIKVGSEPICPPTHPIKGKFDASSAKFFYTEENKSYDRVRPDICFSTEKFALEVAGFVKKY